MKGATYEAAVRMKLDVSQLPKPFQLNALARANGSSPPTGTVSPSRHDLR